MNGHPADKPFVDHMAAILSGIAVQGYVEPHEAAQAIFNEFGPELFLAQSVRQQYANIEAALHKPWPCHCRACCILALIRAAIHANTVLTD